MAESAKSSAEMAHEPVFHALYSFNGSSLSLWTSTLDMNQEAQLRLFLSRRLSKGTVFPNVASISSMEFSLGRGNDSPAVCYYLLMPSRSTPPSSATSGEKEEEVNLILCLLTITTGLLDNFRFELANFTHQVLEEKFDPLNLSHQTQLEATLGRWYSLCIEYISRVITALGLQVSFLLQLALECYPSIVIECKDSSLKEDISRFYEACKIPELASSAERIQKTRKVHVDGKILRVEGMDSCCEFCHLWGQAVGEANTEDPSQIKRILESFKMQVIAAVNNLRKVMKEAETDHYAFYRAYQFLKESGYSKILLEHAQAEKELDSGVIEVLQEHVS